MTEQISTRDWERLSAYLDHDLEAGRRATLEERLRTEPALQRALQRLQRTRDLLRRAPQARVPRSFTLTPAMAGQPKSWLATLNLNAVSALASLMLVVVLLGDLFNFGGAVDLTDLPSFSAAAPAEMEEDSLLFSAEMADEQAAEDGATDSTDQDALPETTQMLPENAGGGLDDFEGENLEERSMATKDEGAASAPVDVWLFLELAFALVALSAGLAARRARS